MREAGNGLQRTREKVKRIMIIGVISDCGGEHILTIVAAVGILYVFRDNPAVFWIDPKLLYGSQKDQRSV